MNRAVTRFGWSLALSAVLGVAWAQDAAPVAAAAPAAAKKSSAQADAGEPRANTSASTPTPNAPQRASTKPAATVVPAGRTSDASPAPVSRKPSAADRLSLGTATVTGDQEQPKVMYIVPWKRSDIGDVSGKPMNSLLDEVLAPVDRDEFKREVVYYQAVQGDVPQNGASNPPAKQGEK